MEDNSCFGYNIIVGKFVGNIQLNIYFFYIKYVFLKLFLKLSKTLVSYLVPEFDKIGLGDETGLCLTHSSFRYPFSTPKLILNSH